MTDAAGTSRILTLVFTDLADSTALKMRRGDQAVGELIARHRAHVRRLAAESGGRIIDWAGDGCFLVFETPSAAVLFALRLQQAHGEEPDLPGVRTGIHNVGAVLEGSVAKAGNQVRITAQLFNIADGYHLWSDSYDRELQDIFAIRSQVAETVAKALQVTLVAGERRGLEQRPTEDVEAYQLYLKGRHAAATFADWGAAMQYFQQAIARDPGYALAYERLAQEIGA